MAYRFVVTLACLAISCYAQPDRAPGGYWDVCGPSNLYSTDYQICCGNRIYQNVRGDISCCGGVAYNSTTHTCHNNEVKVDHQRPAVDYIPPPSVAVVPSGQLASAAEQTGKPTAGYRCGSASVDASVAVSKTTLCCGNVPFDARYQLCSDFGPAPIQAAGIQGALTVSAPEKYYTCGLDQVPSNAVTSFDSAFCCGTVVYDSRYYTCTRNNAVVPQGAISPAGPPPPPESSRPRPSAYPPVSDGFTRVRCLSNLFDVPTNHMSYYSCCGSQAFDERHFVCTTTGSGSPRAEPISSVNRPAANPPAPSIPARQSYPAPQPAPQPAPLQTSQTSTRLQCGKRIYLFGPPSYGKYMECCGDDVYDQRVDQCIGNTKVSGVVAAGKK